MTNTIFTSKEHYISFRAAWSEAVQIAQSHGKKSPEDFGSIAPEQHMLYNILRGKHPECGFTHITNTNKLTNGSYYNTAAFYASMYLDNQRRIAKELLAGKVLPTFLENSMKILIESFNGTVTIEMLAQLEFEKIKPILSLIKRKAA